MNNPRTRPRALVAVAALVIILALLAGCGAPASDGQAAGPGGQTKTVVHIGYQKGGSLPILKGQGALEQRLTPLGVSVEWTEFPAGPPLLEALNTGTIDIGATGQTPPIFAQAGGTPLVYVASLPGATNGQALLAPKNSPITSVAQLKGKKVAFAKGSSAHYFIIRVLEESGLEYADIEPAFLTPPDARPAFEGGSVDAWVIWEPYLTIALKATDARILHDGTSLAPSRSYYLGSRYFAEQHPDLLKAVLEEVQKVEQWSADRPKEVAEVLAPVIGVDAAILEEVARKQRYGLEPIDDATITEQQSIADTFYRLGLIPKQIAIRDVVWKWED